MVSSTPQPHFTPEKDPVPTLQEAGWAPGPVWTGGKSRPHRDSIPDRPARSSVAIPTELPGPHILAYWTITVNLTPVKSCKFCKPSCTFFLHSDLDKSLHSFVRLLSKEKCCPTAANTLRHYPNVCIVLRCSG